MDERSADIGAALLARWRAIFEGRAGAEGRAGIEPGAVEDTGRGLLARYAEPRRRYHNLEHLAEVLEAIDELAASARDVDVVRLAGWFHDAVYDPHRSDNEEASARLAAGLLPTCGVSEPRIAEVVRLVQLTAAHDPGPDDPDGAVLCDADLAILASDPERYGRYASDVRAEYAHVEDEAFRRGRAAILDALLGHDALFHTPAAHARWEERARHNLHTELTLLHP
ncbi:hypothetical protein [Actinopolymorpha alba]|uniref:HD domain-containing protein n=1 Tax=Actinopolymorpha alba TaxID=533267 RepID=UPI00036503F0|nr:hypothetical protein [Actinopolymorpha alba]